MYCLTWDAVVPWSDIDSTLASGRFPRLERVSCELMLEDHGKKILARRSRRAFPPLHDAGLLSVFVQS